MSWWKPSTWKKSPSPASSVPSTGTKVYTSSEAKSLTPSQKASSTIVSSTASASSGTPTGSVSSYINKKSGGSSSGGSSSSNGTTYSGPVQEGTSAETFRDTGTTIQNMSIDKTKARTITPSTKTTTQQISAHQIDVAPDKFDVRGYQKSDMSTKQKLGYAFGKYTSLDTYRNIGADFFGAGKKQGAFNIGGLFTPLAIFNKPKGDIEIKADPYGQGTQIGYGMSDEQTARVTPTYLKDKTGFERLQEKITINPDLAKPQEQIIYEESVGLSKDIEKDIKKTYQDKINAGGDYTKVSKEYETEFNKQYLDRYDKEVFGSDTLKQKKSFSSTLTGYNKPILSYGKVAGTGALIGASFVAPVTTGAYIFGSGFSTGYEGVSEKNYLKAGLGFSMGLTGVGFASSAVGKQIDTMDIAQAVKNQQRIGTGYRYEKGNEFLDVVKFQGKSGEMKVDSSYLGRGKRVGKDIVYGGSQTTEVAGRTYWGNKPFVSITTKEFAPRTFSIQGIKRMELGTSTEIGKDASLGLMKLGERTRMTSMFSPTKKGVRGKITYFSPDKFKGNDLIGGIGKRIETPQGDLIISTGGKVKRINVPTFKGQGFKGVNQKVELIIPDTSESILKVIKVKKTPVGENIIKEIKGSAGSSKKTPFYKTYGGPTQIQQTKHSFPDISAPISKSIKTSPTKLSTRIAPSLSLGTSSKLIQAPSTKQKSFTTSAFASASALNQMEKQKVITLQQGKVIPISRTNTSFATAVTEIQAIKPSQKIITKPVIISSPTTTISSFISPPPPSSLKGFIPPPIFALGGLRKGIGGSLIKSRRSYSYTPSFKAIAFGIKGKGIAPLATTKFTGLELRPIYEKKKKKKGFFNFPSLRF